MYEVEVKVRADHETVREALERLDAERRDTVVQRDVYYDAPHRDFAETDEALRIRRVETEDEGQRAVVTYKGPLVESASKTREEVETPIESVADVQAILSALGFEPAATVEKERERWEVDGYTVALDEVVGLGQFVEVEAEAESEGDVETVREGTFAVLRSLDLDPGEQIRTSYLGLLLAERDAA